MEVKDLVSRHLQSIGAPEALSARKTCLAQGKGSMQDIRGVSDVPRQGPATFVSDGLNFRMRIKFDYPTYPQEEFAYDGKVFNSGMLEVGVRSPLSIFLSRYPGIGKEGLLGGVLSTAWPFLDLPNRNPKLEYRGLKKINGREVHEIKYQMAKGQDAMMLIYLYFDAKTFRHLMTLYTVSEWDIRYDLQETFEDFQLVDGLSLPRHWIIRYTIQSGQEVTTTEWNMEFAKITINRPIDPKVFVLNY